MCVIIISDKTEVSGSSPEWPTKSMVPEGLPIQELLMMLPWGRGGAESLLGQFRNSLGQIPQSADSAA